MRFRAKRSDTLVSSVEADYKINLHARSNMEIGNLLRARGFRSLSEILKAYRGNLNMHPVMRTVFISFHWDDYQMVKGLRLMTYNKFLRLEIEEVSKKAVRSENENYVKGALKKRILNSDVLLCLIGNGTGSRDWVDWEIKTALENKIPICGIRIPKTFGKLPIEIRKRNIPIASWDTTSIIKAIEMAIARGT